MMKKEVSFEGSVRVDLSGGTLDLNPIALILPNVVTLNVATSLKTKVKISSTDFQGITLESQEYKTRYQWNKLDLTPENIYVKKTFGPLTFVVQLLDYLGIHEGVHIEMAASIPPGSGLGGSSAMGVVFFKALLQFLGRSMSSQEIIRIVNSIESRVLDAGPAGYQDYYPALYGGVLGLRSVPGDIEVEQLYSEGLRTYLEKHLTLVYSGQSRLSGINNWEVYKAFFDKNQQVRTGLEKIASVSYEAYTKIKSGNLSGLWELIAAEGEARMNLFSKIVTPEMKDLHDKLKKEVGPVGMKACGAGGGGCYILSFEAPKQDDVKEIVRLFGMNVMELKVEKPI